MFSLPQTGDDIKKRRRERETGGKGRGPYLSFKARARVFKERENGREWERDNYYKSVVLRLESEREENKRKERRRMAGKNKKKRERVRRERERCKNVLPSRSPKQKRQKSTYFV